MTRDISRPDIWGLYFRIRTRCRNYFLQNAIYQDRICEAGCADAEGNKGSSHDPVPGQSGQWTAALTGNRTAYTKKAGLCFMDSRIQYDDDGNIKLDEHGSRQRQLSLTGSTTSLLGIYVLEETICPYEQGYVQSEAVNIEVLETGDYRALRWRTILHPRYSEIRHKKW